jgi:PhnB protein
MNYLLTASIMKSTTKSSKEKSVLPIPEGYHTVTPFLVVAHADLLLEFIKKAFQGEVTSRMLDDQGRVMHATAKIGDSIVMVADAMEKFPPIQSMLYVYVEDVEATYHQALEAKGVSIRVPTDEFYGDRSAGVKDPWNNQWWIATHIEDVNPGEMEKRRKEFEALQDA